MKLNDSMTITKRSADGAFYGEKNGNPYLIMRGHAEYDLYDSLYNVMRATAYNARAETFNTLVKENRYPTILNDAVDEATLKQVKDPKAALLKGVKQLMDFFSEFSFIPSFRFTNTLAYMACQNSAAAIQYVTNYFALMDSSYAKEVSQKVQSPEFKDIISKFAQYGEPQDHVNTRLKIYFGNAGTGKTTLAQQESDNRCIVCNSSMLPADLMEDFIFKDGQPDFNPSLLWNCMENGTTVVLDEINLLPFDSLRFLQGIVDGKKEFYYKNRPVHIKDGFQIIGTMNLSLGGMTYGLPEPLVDRCSEAREFKLTAEQLMKAIVGMEEE